MTADVEQGQAATGRPECREKDSCSECAALTKAGCSGNEETGGSGLALRNTEVWERRGREAT